MAKKKKKASPRSTPKPQSPGREGGNGKSSRPAGTPEASGPVPEDTKGRHAGSKGGNGRDAPGPEVSGTSIWQKHGGPGGCGSWATEAKGTKTQETGDCKIVTRRRWCNACQTAYSHVTVFKWFTSSWSESGSAFK